MDDERELTIKEYQEKIQFQYEINNITHEKSELYCDFLLSLLNIINETYLGSDLLETNKDIASHFSWCFNKVLENFKEERIIFNPLTNNSSYNYIWFFFYDGYYMSTLSNKHFLLSEYILYLFDYTVVKTTREIDAYIDFYKILDQNLKKIN